MRYEMVYFDLDGTLLDFAKAEREAISTVLAEFGIPLSDDQIRMYVEINKKWWRFLSEGKASKDRIVIARFEEFLSWLRHTEISPAEVSERYLERLSNCGYFLPGAEEFLKKMKALNVRMAALTNGVHSVQERRAKLLKLERFFEFMITSELCGKPKPDPAMFLLAASKSGVPLTQSVYVGDDPVTDYLAAKNAEADFILLDLDSVHPDFDGLRATSYDELFDLLTCESIIS
ncbi:MAG: HAD superfamily (Subfamily IA) hydrolase, TIGR02254 [Thermotoga sp. 50_1627]|uniref:YjjG family noncanonical pyrimidine nucleotidase n=1 Tax=Pseudothermotoga sp. TaxID=2033661 RepID=UPI00076CF5C2|nr:MAG: HAD superfamily (Subfamily IA) hydrolase, TIGR02254 [Thermotoga sp. 50_64]KUK24176.1 MAG: HAD superfamily (Subfamily IA) hydrolase, TIGR02254 [Thermotoga sp. 50_1627]MBC7115858.1 noncanonical pyrimidine nucleotidase, YjjG family [Pseudothermotoga sp.]MDK2923478.1 putative hydrolase of the superfamily [Pseudothermotoga sp.]HBT38849.1 noncanonical pyrimidine nucleotidase, YjjG family [Pseudothermotoga sp.]